MIWPTHTAKKLLLYTWTIRHHASHNLHDEEVYNLKRKVDWLHQYLHCKAWIREERTPTPTQSSSSRDDQSYRRRSRTPPNESFTSSSHYTFGEKDPHKRSRTPPQRTIGKMLLQISRSPFTRCIEQVELPRHFNQPSFTIYNCKMDLVKHVSQL